MSRGETDDVEVHHVKPVNAYPECELDPANFRTVRPDIHRLVGHCLDFRSWNPNFDRDAEHLRKMIAERKYGR
ncbi:MAG: hypothetical protein ACREA9_23225 [Pyrinomonadaceae bacterium]